jgi:hypothetical protein
MHIYIQMLWSGALQNPGPWAAALPAPPSGLTLSRRRHIYATFYFSSIGFLIHVALILGDVFLIHAALILGDAGSTWTALIQNLTVRCPVVNRDGVAPLLLCDLVALHFFGWGGGVEKNSLYPGCKPLCLYFLTYFKIGSILLQ